MESYGVGTTLLSLAASGSGEIRFSFDLLFICEADTQRNDNWINEISMVIFLSSVRTEHSLAILHFIEAVS